MGTGTYCLLLNVSTSAPFCNDALQITSVFLLLNIEKTQHKALVIEALWVIQVEMEYC